MRRRPGVGEEPAAVGFAPARPTNRSPAATVLESITTAADRGAARRRNRDDPRFRRFGDPRCAPVPHARARSSARATCASSNGTMRPAGELLTLLVALAGDHHTSPPRASEIARAMAAWRSTITSTPAAAAVIPATISATIAAGSSSGDCRR